MKKPLTFLFFVFLGTITLGSQPKSARRRPLKTTAETEKKQALLQVDFNEASREGVVHLLQNGADVGVILRSTGSETDPLHLASGAGRLDLVTLLVENGADINKNLLATGTPLMSAVRASQFQVAEYLVRKGADINARMKLESQNAIRSCDETALRSASEKANINFLKLLVRPPTPNPLVPDMDGALLCAAMNGRTGNLKYLVENGGDANSRQGQMALADAIRQNNLPLATILVKSGAPVNGGNDPKSTPLSIAGAQGNLDMVRLLVENGANVNENGSDESSFIKAVAGGRIDIVKFMVEKGVDLQLLGAAAVNQAAQNGRTDLVKYLAAKDVSLEALTPGWQTPLLSAIAAGRIDTAKWLLRHGANVNFKPQYGLTALELADRLDHMMLVRILLHHGAKPELVADPFVRALIENDVSAVAALLADRFDVNSKINDSPALMVAVKHGNPEIVKRLIAKGAAVDVRDDQGATPLLVAAERGMSPVIKVLLDAGADINGELYQDSGLTALCTAVRTGELKAAEYLMARNALVNSPRGQLSPLYCAAERGFTDTARKLLDNGAHPDDYYWNGGTPLIIASQNGHDDIVRLLLRAKASVNLGFTSGHDIPVIEKTGRTALMSAAAAGHATIVRLILQSGADPNVYNEESGSALLSAAAQGRLTCVEILMKAGAAMNLGDPFAAALNAGHTDVADYLLRRGWNLNTVISWETRHQKGTNSSYLVKASYFGRPGEAAYLLSRGIDPNSADTLNQATALVYAVSIDSRPAVSLSGQDLEKNEAADWANRGLIVQSLLGKGADPNLQDRTGQTALMYAAAEGRDELIRLLLSHQADPQMISVGEKTALMLAESRGYDQTAVLLRAATVPSVKK